MTLYIYTAAGHLQQPIQLATRLSDHHLSCLLHQLSTHASKWREIGTHLGYTQGELNNIQESPYLNSPVSWLTAMLSQWFQWAPGDSRRSTSFATLRTLKDAVSKAGLGTVAYDLKIEPHT